MARTASAGSQPKRAASIALRFVILIGVVSFFADMTYEGSRSITGPYLAVLGASATVVGFVAGFGELVGYGLRLVSGRMSDKTSQYWPIAIFGYIIQMAAVPLLALAGRWEVAAVLIIVERIGKAIRNPPRDVMLAHATREMGRGWGFGVHEALDQSGAVVGPLIAAGVLFFRGQYQTAFAILAIPAVLTLSMLAVARFLYPRPEELEANASDVRTGGLPRVFWFYVVAAALVAAGFTDFSLMAYHFQQAAVIPKDWIPLFYSLAAAFGGAGSLILGRLFDRVGIVVLIPLTVASSAFAPLVFLGGAVMALVGTALWGIGVGVQESIMAAAVAGMVPAMRRGSAYGIFTTGYGLFWFMGSALMGFLYDKSVPALVVFSIVIQLASVPLFVVVTRRAAAIAGPRQ
ncbi:MAG: MFS transporter [Chloroflexota bacterium]